jgi:hypothetical protein
LANGEWKMKDECFVNMEKLLRLVLQENANQIKKWGIQNHDISKWLAFTTKKHRELTKAISEYEFRNGSIDDIIKEAIQNATLTLKIAEMYIKLKENKTSLCPKCGKDYCICECTQVF